MDIMGGNQMKVLYVSKMSILAGAGGAEQRIDRVTKRLSESGHEVTILCGRTDPSLDKVTVDNGRKIRHIKCIPDTILRLNDSAFYLVFFIFPIISVFSLTWHLLKDDFDLVVDHMTPHPTLAVIACKILNTPIAIVVHGFFGKEMYKTYGFITSTIQLLAQNFLRIFEYDIIICPTTYIKEELIDYGVSPQDIDIIPNGVDAKEMQSSDSPNNREGVVTIGRLTKTKGHDTVIRAIAQLQQRKEHCPQLHIIGEGPYMSELESLVSELGLNDTVVLEGFVSEKRKIELLRSSAVFAYGSKYESFGIVLLEAMAAGLPVVAVQHPAYEDFFTSDINGELVDDDPDLMAEAINKYLQDPSLCQEVGDRNMAYVREEYSWEAIGRETEKKLVGVLAL